MKLLTQLDIIKKFIEIHGYYFDYSKVVYINMITKVCIICPIHGEFYQTPGNHLKGKGCKKCANTKLSLFKTHDIIKFLEKAITIHGNKYDYSKVIYIDSKTKVCIICPIHGEFWQTPDNHLTNGGCYNCGVDNIKFKQRSTNKNFIEKSNIVHNFKFGYENTTYLNNSTKVCVTCLTDDHGDFWVTPANHLKGRGCPICKASKGELAIKSILDKYDILNEPEYIIPEVISQLKYDFYLPDYRLLIEFHGIQHYEYSPFFHKNNEDNFLKQKERDIIKKDHAYRFKYKLLEFNYQQLKELTKDQFEELILRTLNLQSN